MRTIHRLLLAAAAGLATLTAGCATSPADLKLTPASPKALLVIKTAATDRVLKIRAGYYLAISEYDAATGLLKLGPWPYVGRSDKEEFQVIALNPGVYALQDVHIGSGPRWGSCFNGGTFSFNLRAGEVVYLGRVDPNLDLIRIGTQLPKSGTQSSVYYVFDTPRPLLLPPDAGDAWRAEVSTFLASTSPGVQAPLRAAELKPATFSTGRDLFGLQKLCGGYYQKARPAS